MGRTIVGLALIGLGVGVAVLSGLANVIGLSSDAVAAGEFGWKQIVGVSLGLIVAVIGLLLTVRGRRGSA